MDVLGVFSEELKKEVLGPPEVELSYGKKDMGNLSDQIRALGH